MYCVVDTERIKGNRIYLLSYQLYDERFNLIESKTFIDVSIDVSNRISPKRKVEKLKSIAVKVNSFVELYSIIRKFMEQSINIIFSITDVKIFRKNCVECGIEYKELRCIDVQKISYKMSSDAKKKSNLRDYCIQNHIFHTPHIPESDCEATFKVFCNLLLKKGEKYLFSLIKEY